MTDADLYDIFNLKRITFFRYCSGKNKKSNFRKSIGHRWIKTNRKEFNLKIGLLLMMLFLSACHQLNTNQAVNGKQVDATSKNAQYIKPLHNTRSESAVGPVQKVNNFFVIVDSSSSVNDEYQRSGLFGLPAGSKFLIEKELLRRINNAIPAELQLSSGIRKFGHGPCGAWQETILVQSLTGYEKPGFAEKIEGMDCASGGSPAASALFAANMDLASAHGNIAVIFISDGNFSADLSTSAIKRLKSRYGDNLCLYPVWTGNIYEPDGKQVLERLRLAAQCGFSTEAAGIASEKAMANYVHEVFYNFDHKIVSDSDHDHIADNIDQCPNTPEGATVNNVGCWIIEGIKFDTGKSDIKSEYYYLLDRIVAVLNRNPSLKIEVQGHTDNVASAEYNLQLSQRRAVSVLSYLEAHGINEGVLVAKGYGLNRPVDTNATESGRSNNRRVELKILNRPLN